MRRTLTTVLFAALLAGHPIAGQILDQTMVPRGTFRLQAFPRFESWDARFGRAADGTEGREELGDDLTDPTTLSLFPGIATLAELVGGMTGASGYTPVLGSSQGRITQDVTRIDFGGHLGIFDWLTVGAVLPWVRTRTAIDQLFLPDTLNGDIGINPSITNSAGMNAFISATAAAQASAAGSASAICGAGPGPACTAAQALATRAASFNASIRGAYGASPFFPIAGSAIAASLAQSAAMLSADLIAAGLGGLTAPMAFATDWLTTADFPLLPTRPGFGIDAAALRTRTGLWGAGDLEVSALVRLLDNLAPRAGEPPPAFGYRLTMGLLARLPTGIPEDPDILLDIGTGDAQTDYEGSLIASLTFGRRFALAAGGRYGVQGSTTLTKRVAPPELAMPPVGTRQLVTWKPGFYLGIDVVPSLRVTPELSVTGQYRFFQKGRDAFELVDATVPLDPTVLEVESGIKAHQVGAGLRYDTVTRWMRGEAPRPMEIQLRILHTIAGSGGQTPASTRVEAGIRLFKRFWGARR